MKPSAPSDGATVDAGNMSIDELLAQARTACSSIQEQANSATAASHALAQAAAENQRVISEVNASATQVLAAKTQVLDDQTVVAAKSDHIQQAQEHADKVRADLDRALTSATQQATEAEGLKARAQVATDGATALLTGIQTSKGLVDSDAATIATARDAAKESVAMLKNLSDKALTVDERIGVYEERLASLEAQCADQLKTIIDLLPGATSAGLAHAFDARRQTFLSPSRKWQWLFIGSVGVLTLLALSGMWHVYQGDKVITYDELGRLWLARLPVAGALVWLALHASRESALAKRLEEDYGYKAAIASSFLGFHKQMSEIGAAATPDTPLARLCANTLAAIASPPGRIYDKHELTVSPTGEMKDVAKTLTGHVDAAQSTAK